MRHVTKQTWSDWAKAVAYPFEPEEHAPAAIDKLMDKLDDYVVRCKGIKWQFKAQNQTKIVDFDNAEDKKFYDSAWERYLKEKARYLKEKARLEKEKGLEEGEGVTGLQILAQFTKFRQASELCHANHITDAMHDAWLHGQAPVSGLNFKHTVVRCVKNLIEKHGYKREDISIIWGGGVTITKKAKQQAAMASNPVIQAGLRAAGITMDDIGLGEDDVAAVDKLLQDEKIPKEWNLGAQNKKQRQVEIDNFQSGRSKFCFFTFKSGGVGLSLHHCDEQVTEYNRLIPGYEEWEASLVKRPKSERPLAPGKVGRKKSGYAVAEDIKYITTRPRICFLTPTYSAMELVQGLGRCPRINSLSDTPQIILFFRGTIEERVAEIVTQKLKCLQKVVRGHEDWCDIIVEAQSSEDANARAIRRLHEGESLVATVTGDEDDEPLDISEDEEDE